MKKNETAEKVAQGASSAASIVKAFAPLLIIVVVILFAGKAIKQMLAQFGFIKPPEQVAIEKQASDGVIKIVEGSKKAIENQYAVQQPTKTDAEWLVIANQIYDDLRYATTLDNKPDDAVYQLCRPKNDSDVYKLIQAFGYHQSYYFGVVPTNPQDLNQYVHQYLSAKHIAVINDNYKRKGIKYSY